MCTRLPSTTGSFDFSEYISATNNSNIFYWLAHFAKILGKLQFQLLLHWRVSYREKYIRRRLSAEQYVVSFDANQDNKNSDGCKVDTCTCYVHVLVFTATLNMPRNRVGTYMIWFECPRLIVQKGIKKLSL